MKIVFCNFLQLSCSRLHGAKGAEPRCPHPWPPPTVLLTEVGDSCWVQISTPLAESVSLSRLDIGVKPEAGKAKPAAVRAALVLIIASHTAKYWFWYWCGGTIGLVLLVHTYSEPERWPAAAC